MRYTPSVYEGERAYIDGLSGTSRTRAESAAEYRRMIAEVERSAAVKALTEAADDWESGTVEHDEIRRTSDAPLGWSDESVMDAVMSSGPVMTWLRKRAAAYRREETE